MTCGRVPAGTSFISAIKGGREETRGDLGPYMHATTEAAPSTPTSEETEQSSSPAGQVSESTQTGTSA